MVEHDRTDADETTNRTYFTVLITTRKNRLRFKARKFQFGLMKAGQGLAGDNIKNPQFVSFLQQSGFRERINPDHYEKKMRRRRVAAYAVLAVILTAFSWIMLESAQALSLF